MRVNRIKTRLVGEMGLVDWIAMISAFLETGDIGDEANCFLQMINNKFSL